MNVRLAYHHEGDRSLKLGPTIRLAGPHSPILKANDMALKNPTVRLAHCPGAQGDNTLAGRKNVAQVPQERAPALLVSFVYLPGFLDNREDYHYRDWVLDSGAWSAYQSGVVIDIYAYIEMCKELCSKPDAPTEIFALDVIGDWKASLKNTEIMWENGVEAIPAFHYGSPWEALDHITKNYPKIALGGVAGMRGNKKYRWFDQCFARSWPKKIHGFSVGDEMGTLRLPWHSVDSTNWEMGPCAFGKWMAFGNMSVRGSSQDLRAEIEWYLKLEQRARWKWREEMKMLDELDEPHPDIRLCYNNPARITRKENV